MTMLLTRALALGLLLAAAVAFGLWRDGAAKAARIGDLRNQLSEQRADAAALRALAGARQRVTISYREAIQGLDPNALSQACRADPQLSAAYDAVERMRRDYEAHQPGPESVGGLPDAADNPKPGR
jgi:hypothetical protein